MINTYKKIKEKKSNFIISDIEDFIKFENEKSLDEYINAKDGLSYAGAIVVTASTEKEGIAWEYDWLKQNGCLDNFGYSRPVKQSLSSNSGQNYDIITAACSDGKQIDYYFMIDNYFGKW